MCAIVPVPSSTMMYRCCHASAALMVHCSARSACLLGWHRHCIKASHVVKEMSVPFSVLPSWPALMDSAAVWYRQLIICCCSDTMLPFSGSMATLICHERLVT